MNRCPKLHFLLYFLDSFHTYMNTHNDIEKRLQELEEDLFEATWSGNEKRLSQLQNEYNDLTRKLLGEI